MRFGLSGLLSAVVLYAAAGVQPRDLRCEYRDNPKGIDSPSPRLTWTLAPANPKARGLHQKAYRILVASSESALRANRGDLWDSGRVESANSVLVPYAGKPLPTGAAAFWKVQVWDQDNAPSDWSAAARWSVGLLRPDDWHGQWIGRDDPGVYKDGSPFAILEGARWIWDSANAEASAPAGDRYFRLAFTVPAGRGIARALAIFGADSNADVYLNGAPVATSSSAAMPQAHYVTQMIHAGENLLAIKAVHDGANSPAGLIGALRIDFTSGDPLIVQTSNTWRASAKAGSDWYKPGFLDAAWQPAKDFGALGIAPWKDAPYVSERRLPARMLRKEFAVDKQVRRAMVYYSGLGLSELWLNGAKVGDHVLSPGLTDYDKHVLYETFDVTRQLARGRNAIGLWLGNGRYHAPRTQVPIGTRNFGDPKAIVQLNIEYDDGSSASVVSDGSWRLTTAGPIRANNEYDGEDYDARMEIADWSKPGFNESSWEPARIVSAPPGVLVPQAAEPLRVTETLKPVSVKKLANGVYIFDMGQNMVGWTRLRVSGPKGAQVILRHAETLRPDGSLYMDNLRSARATDIYTLKGGGVEVYEPRFTYHGFRYVELTGFSGEPTAAALEGRVAHDDMERIADFTSSNTLLNRIHKNMFWGIRGNYRSIPTDCPQRDERQGWLGDRSQVSRSESYMFNVAAFYTKWTRDLEDAQRADGAIPDVAPNFWPIYSDNLTWPGTFLFIPGTLYEQYGDRRPLEQAWPDMKKWIAHIRTFAKDGLMPKDTYGDWCVPPEDPKLIHSKDPARVTDKTLIGTAYYYKLLTMMAGYARLLDRPVEAEDYAREASQANAAFQKKFFKPFSGIYDNGTQTSSVLPLYFDMVPAEYRAAVVKSLTDRIESESHGHVGTGLVGAQWLMRTLSENGHADTAYQIAAQTTYPGWGYMVERGATTVWELWNGDTADPAMNSGNHVMQIGDLAVWMYEYLAGIRSDPQSPGFRHTIIRPYPAGDLTFVKASHRTPYGTIASSWKRGGGSFNLDVTIPPNTTATVWIPTNDAAGVTESGRAISSARGVKLLRQERGAAVFEVESGVYSFRAAL
jgi:alpha-L-rhamnosidase